MTQDEFLETSLPRVGKSVGRLGVAGNYGLETDDITYAAERGVRFWLWTPNFKKVTPALRQILSRDREKHVVATLVGIGYTAGQVRRNVHKSLRLLGVEQLDVCMLGWLGKTTALTRSIQDELVALRESGKVTAVGCSIHDRKRAGQLAHDSELDAFMIRYNAKHPGAEQDIFPHVDERKPLIIAYTATSWGQLLRPLSGIDMPPWPGLPQAQAMPPLSPELCYRFCLSQTKVHVVMTGPKNRAQLDANLKALDAGPLSAQEDIWVREYGRKVKARKRFPFI
jgi:aryl-alcohol dehydrogenase-like predicted oxidoreductase